LLSVIVKVILGLNLLVLFFNSWLDKVKYK